MWTNDDFELHADPVDTIDLPAESVIAALHSKYAVDEVRMYDVATVDGEQMAPAEGELLYSFTIKPLPRQEQLGGEDDFALAIDGEGTVLPLAPGPTFPVYLLVSAPKDAALALNVTSAGKSTTARSAHRPAHR